MAQTDPYDALLPRVQKPSRYLGTELNSAHKDPGRVRLRACLAFPDSYDLGLGNLGLQILYGILNRREDIWAERVCAPHPDLELELRRAGLPLFALESRAPLHQFDLLGFTLQWELNYTNILNMLDLGGIPPLATERTDAHPIVIAGGLALTGAAMLWILGPELLTQPWLLVALMLYAINLLVMQKYRCSESYG